MSVVACSSKWHFSGWKEYVYLQETWICWQKLAVHQKAPGKKVPLGNKANYFRCPVNSSPYSKNDIFQKQRSFKNLFTINSFMSKGYCLWFHTGESITAQIISLNSFERLKACVWFSLIMTLLPQDNVGVLLCHFKYESKCYVTIPTRLCPNSNNLPGRNLDMKLI